jgi:CheY-like chemotaxis protein
MTPRERGLARRILIADDDLDTVETMSLLLRQLGHEVAMTTEAATVLGLAAQLRPQLILLDIGMPDMDGWQIARALRKALGHDEVRIVAVSGRTRPEDFVRSRQAGFDAHVPKPVDMALIERMLEEIR